MSAPTCIHGDQVTQCPQCWAQSLQHDRESNAVLGAIIGVAASAVLYFLALAALIAFVPG